jgi:hypothetical protein
MIRPAMMAALALALALVPGAAAAQPNAEWRRVATEQDAGRIRDLRDAWEEALASARAAGHGAEVDREGSLLSPDGALVDPAPPPGDYACRTIKVGHAQPGLLGFVSYPAFRCRVRIDHGRLSFEKLTGSQRPLGRFYADRDERMVFVGTIQLGDERRSYQYGVDRDRDMIGALERIGERRWRLVFPYPRFESLLDVIELTPVR